MKNLIAEPIIQVSSTPIFDKWYDNLKDIRLIAAINRRIDNIAMNAHFGDFKNIGGDLYELRIFLGAGIRIYYAFDGVNVVLLLCGGDKSTQERDITKAKQILKEIENGN